MPSRSHLRRVRALSMVSAVVKVLDTTTTCHCIATQRAHSQTHTVRLTQSHGHTFESL